MKQKELFETVERQFAKDFNCVGKAPTFTRPDGTRIFLQPSSLIEGARIYEGKSLFFKAAASFNTLYVMVDEALYEWAVTYFKDVSPEWFCAFPNLRAIDRKLGEYGHEILDTHLYFLPDLKAPDIEISVPVKWFGCEEILKMKENNPFCHALAYSKTQPDVIAVAAMDGEKIMGMAGASEDGEYLWQIGIDVLCEYRGNGLAEYLTRLLKQEILKRGKIPFYGTSESHGISRKVAVKSGFLPAWAEIYVK